MILSGLLEQDCLLCGATAAALLCEPCRLTLPAFRGPACPVCAEPLSGPAVCGTCLSHPPDFDATFAACLYVFPIDRLVQALKYGHRLAVADLLADLMLAGPRPEGDIILPVPLALPRLRQRGFNQSAEIGRKLARSLTVPMLLDGCSRRRDTVAQATLPWQVRRRNIRHAFECGVDLTGKTVIAVDDVMTSGATLDEFAATLKAHGARRVVNWIAARTPRNTIAGT